MSKLNARTVCSLFGLFTILALLACNDNAKNALKSELNTTGFNLVDPANDWIYAGGVAVYDNQNPKAGTTFYGLPQGVQKPQTVPATAVWGADKINSNFTLQALVAGVGTVVKAGLGVNHSKQITLAQINGSGTRVEHPEAIVSDPAVSSQLKTWLTGGRFSVYIVNTALNTTSLSATTTSATGVTAAFGDTLPQCQNSSTGNNSSGGNGVTTNGGSNGSNNNGSSGATGTESRSGASLPGAATSGGGTAPTGTLQACKNSDSSFTLNTQTALVFATLTNAVTLQADGTLQVLPVTAPVPGGEERRKPIPTQAEALSGKWEQNKWPGR